MAESFNTATDRLLKKASGAMSKATLRALNRTADATRTRAVRAIQEDVGATSQKSIRKFIAVDRASDRRQEARVIARSKGDDRIPLYEMGPRPRQVARRRRPRGTGITYGPQNKFIAGAFIARMRSGHIGVFKRLTAKRFPVVELRGPSASWVFGGRKVTTILMAFIKDKLPGELAAQARFYGGKIGIGVD